DPDAAGAPAPAGAEADPEQCGRYLSVGRGGGAVQESPLVLPLRDGPGPVGIRSAGRRAPGVLAEQQQIAPHPPARRGSLLDPVGRPAVARLGLLVPQREQLRGPGDQLGRAVAPELRRGGRGAVLAITPGVAAPYGQLRAPAPLHLAEEVLRSRRHETRVGEPTGKLLDV